MYELRMQKYFKSLCKLPFQSLNSTSPEAPLCSSTDIVIAVRKLSNQTSWVRQPQTRFLSMAWIIKLLVSNDQTWISQVLAKIPPKQHEVTLDLSHHHRQKHSLQKKKNVFFLSVWIRHVYHVRFRLCNHVTKDAWNITTEPWDRMRTGVSWCMGKYDKN